MQIQQRPGILAPIICFLVLVAVVAGCKGPAATPTPTPTPTLPTSTPGPTALISGTVYKDENGDGIYDVEVDIPVPAAIVTAYLGDGFMAKDDTDEKGEYALSAPAGSGYTIEVSLPSEEECYDPESGMWGSWSTIEGRLEGVEFPAENVDISIKYRMLNYGPTDYSWELWHEGPIFEQNNVILVHGGQICLVPRILEFGDGKQRGVHDDGFNQLDQLLQRREHGQFNVWEFEYADAEISGRYWTHGSIPDYGNRLGTAIYLVKDLSNGGVSIVAHSMGGLVARYAAQNLGGVDKVLTLATGHFGFEHTGLGALVTGYTCLIQIQPGSRFLWELNTRFQHGDFQLASIAASKDEPLVSPLAGVVRYSSASLVQCNRDGNVTYDPTHTYFTIVPGTHEGIVNINLQTEDRNKDDDFVFEGVRIFLQSGISDRLRMWSGHMYPGERATSPYFTFRFSEAAPQGYPRVWVGERRISDLEMFTTEGEMPIWTFSAQSGEEGVITIEYASGEYKYGSLTRGQSAIMTNMIDN